MPPITAAMSPAATGAPDAIAMPSESGSATRKTTIEDGTSWRRISEKRSDSGPELRPEPMGAGIDGGGAKS
ncbi:hypothetical protein IFM12275_01820 [Nocardia sputorum]|uniref:Uncharacterized protein n=1 Tax=Nocardia sputorum TaxID=2984338 RepID=A0ABM8CV25_9NOCA|nr:hypothetical protein IFM12275_01820 [Nocardia sputorum]BDT98826.1 hypothetical protein IFM12276_18550 [Nocardia sputorum]